jgi:hypothetical protein
VKRGGNRVGIGVGSGSDEELPEEPSGEEESRENAENLDPM